MIIIGMRTPFRWNLAAMFKEGPAPVKPENEQGARRSWKTQTIQSWRFLVARTNRFKTGKTIIRIMDLVRNHRKSASRKTYGAWVAAEF